MGSSIEDYKSIYSLSERKLEVLDCIRKASIEDTSALDNFVPLDSVFVIILENCKDATLEEAADVLSHFYKQEIINGIKDRSLVKLLPIGYEILTSWNRSKTEPPKVLEQKIMAQVEQKIEQKVEQKIEQKIEQKVEQKIIAQVEQKIKQKVEQKEELPLSNKAVINIPDIDSGFYEINEDLKNISLSGIVLCTFDGTNIFKSKLLYTLERIKSGALFIGKHQQEDVRLNFEYLKNIGFIEESRRQFALIYAITKTGEKFLAKVSKDFTRIIESANFRETIRLLNQKVISTPKVSKNNSTIEQAQVILPVVNSPVVEEVVEPKIGAPPVVTIEIKEEKPSTNETIDKLFKYTSQNTRVCLDSGECVFRREGADSSNLDIFLTIFGMIFVACDDTMFRVKKEIYKINSDFVSRNNGISFCSYVSFGTTYTLAFLKRLGSLIELNKDLIPGTKKEAITVKLSSEGMKIKTQILMLLAERSKIDQLEVLSRKPISLLPPLKSRFKSKQEAEEIKPIIVEMPKKVEKSIIILNEAENKFLDKARERLKNPKSLYELYDILRINAEQIEMHCENLTKKCVLRKLKVTKKSGAFKFYRYQLREGV